MDAVNEIKSLIGDLRTQISTKDEAIAELGAKLSKVEDAVEKITDKGETVGFTDAGKGKAFLSWVNDLANQKAMTEGVPADGGYTVPNEFVPELVRLVNDYGFIRKYATIIPMKGNSLTMPSLTTGVTSVWVDEASAIGETKPTFSQISLTNKKLASLVPISNELLDDSSLTMANLVVNLIAESMANEEDRVGFTGSTTGGDPYNGILNTSGINSVVMSSGKTAFTDINPDFLLDMTDAVPRVARRGASFFMNREVFNVVRKLKDTTGNYIVQSPANGLGLPTIWGYPVVDLDVMPSLSDSGASKPFAIFGNPKYMYLGDRQSIVFARSVHYAFNVDVTYIRATERIGFAVGLPQAFARLVTAAA